jgi:hypothetical protein
LRCCNPLIHRVLQALQVLRLRPMAEPEMTKVTTRFHTIPSPTLPSPFTYRGHAVAQWLRHCATNRKVTGSIPDGVIGIFHWHNPSGRTMSLGSTQPLTEMSTRKIYWG